MTLVYPEGDYGAFLTAVFETWKHRAPEWTIAPDDGGWFPAEGPRRLVARSEEAARRVHDGLADLAGPEARRTALQAFLHADRGREQVVAEFIRACVKHRQAVMDRLADPEVREALRRARAVRGEGHRWLGLARFEQHSGLWYAKFEPDHDVLPLLALPFEKRFEGRPWMLHDLGRRRAWLSQGGEGTVVRNLVLEAPPATEAGGAEIQGLWKTHFSNAAIAERRNPRTQRSKMPQKTWTHLVEEPGAPGRSRVR